MTRTSKSISDALKLGSTQDQRSQNMPLKVAVRNIGCRLNRVEADLIASNLERSGCQIVDADDADAIVINTCAVTGESEAKCRKAIRHASALPQDPLVVACGCAATLCARELAELGPRVVIEQDKKRVADVVLRELGMTAANVTGKEERLDMSESRAHLRGITPTGRTRPGIKVQDGCNMRCTYCIVWKARGPARSIDPDQVVAQIHCALDHGAHEVVLSGINLGSYQWNSDGYTVRLPELIELILEKTSIERVRLSSIEPLDVTAQLLSVMATSNGRVAPFLHICLQAGCDATLSRMARTYNCAAYRDIVLAARKALPDLALGTDLIVGFPGETDEDFEESLAFCREMRFARMHVFRYSRRLGTLAAMMPDQIPPRLSADRSCRMRKLAFLMRRDAIYARIAHVEHALVVSPGKAVTGGLFDILVDSAFPVGSLVDVFAHRVLLESCPILDARRADVAMKPDDGPSCFLHEEPM